MRLPLHSNVINILAYTCRGLLFHIFVLYLHFEYVLRNNVSNWATSQDDFQ